MDIKYIDNNKVKKQQNSDIIESLDKPIRMCIVCRDRIPQRDLYRFQLKNGEIVNFTKKGRSFYLCGRCIDSKEKKIEKILNSKFKINIKSIVDIGKILKELGRNG